MITKGAHAQNRAIAKEYSLAKQQITNELDSFKSQQELELRNYEIAQRDAQTKNTSLGSAKGRDGSREDDAIREQAKAFKDEQKRALENLKQSLSIRKWEAKQKQLTAQYELSAQYLEENNDPSTKASGLASLKHTYETLSNRNKVRIAVLEGMDKAEANAMHGFDMKAARIRARNEEKAVAKEQRIAERELKREQRPELKAAEEKARRLAATAGMTEEQKAQRMTDINNEKIKSGLMGRSRVALSRLAQRDEQNFMDSQPMLTNYADRSRAFGAYQRRGLTFDDSYEQAFGNAYDSPSGSGVLYASKGGSMTKPLDFRKGGFVPVKDKKK